jgi:hypothetical protein
LLGEAALTVAGLAVGVGYTIASHSAASATDDAQSRLDAANTPCGGAAAGSVIHPDCIVLADAAADHYRYRNMAVAGFVGAAIGAAAFATTWVVWKPKVNAGSERLIPSAAVSPQGAVFTWRY